MPDYICDNCGGRVGMMAHYLRGLTINGEWRRFPNGEGAQSCSPDYTRLARRHFGHVPGFEESLARFREGRPEVQRISRAEFRERIRELPE